jgi:hypothetical protein
VDRFHVPAIDACVGAVLLSEPQPARIAVANTKVIASSLRIRSPGKLACGTLMAERMTEYRHLRSVTLAERSINDRRVASDP